MTEIRDLGNGYGLIRGYRSRYATLTFPFDLSVVKRLYREGYIDKNEAITVLLWMGYSEGEITILLAWIDITQRRKERGLTHARTI